MSKNSLPINFCFLDGKCKFFSVWNVDVVVDIVVDIVAVKWWLALLVACLLFSVVNFDVQFGHFIGQILPHLFTDTFAIVVLVAIAAAAATPALKINS